LVSSAFALLQPSGFFSVVFLPSPSEHGSQGRHENREVREGRREQIAEGQSHSFEEQGWRKQQRFTEQGHRSTTIRGTSMAHKFSRLFAP
jgi:hypothetical protein